MIIKLVSLLLMALSAAPAAAGSTVTLYRDGSIITRDASARKGVIIVPLAAGMLEGTLKVSPAAGTSLLGVEVIPAQPADKGEKELDALLEGRRRLEDRLHALATREEIFTAAAKSQSGKAPRKTKANPDPLQTIRQGTDFAIAQLETVYTTRRRTEQDIKRIDARLAAAGKRARVGESSARITVIPAHGTVTVRYVTGETGWQPHYDLLLAGNGTAQLRLSARLTTYYPGYAHRVSPASYAEGSSAATFPIPPSSLATLAGYTLPLAEERYGEWPSIHFSGRITNTGPHYLSPGETGLYKNGAYVGHFRFEGLSSGRSRVISMGI